MGEVRQVVVGGTVKVLESEMSATEREKAGMDNYSSPLNLGGNPSQICFNILLLCA